MRVSGTYHFKKRNSKEETDRMSTSWFDQMLKTPLRRTVCHVIMTCVVNSRIIGILHENEQKQIFKRISLNCTGMQDHQETHDHIAIFVYFYLL